MFVFHQRLTDNLDFNLDLHVTAALQKYSYALNCFHIFQPQTLMCCIGILCETKTKLRNYESDGFKNCL